MDQNTTARLSSVCESKRTMPQQEAKLTQSSEIPGIRAVHFLLKDHLDRSYNASSTYDGLGKNVCEYLRAKYVEIPNKFLRRGRV